MRAVNVEEIRAAVEGFLQSSKEPALLEPGEELFPLTAENFTLEMRGSRLTLQAWDRTRNLTRRIVAVGAAASGRLELTIERFAKREGAMYLIDLARRSGAEMGAAASGWCSANASGCCCGGSFRNGPWRN